MRLFFFLFIILFFISCQKSLILDDIIFDNNSFDKISINVEKKDIVISYEPSLNDPYIEHVMEVLPSRRIYSWLDNNFNTFGTMNILLIDIQKASISRKEFKNQAKVNVAGITKETKEYKYEINLAVQFTLYDDSNQILATVNAEAFRSTTSSAFISLNERSYILDELTLKTLEDLSKESFILIKDYMSEYVL